MKNLIRVMAVLGLATSFAVFAEEPPTPPPAAPPEVAPDPQVVANAPVATQQIAPDTTPTVPAGQWVYTAQYGWVYMPYADAYSNVPASGAPSMYVYTSTAGWGWVSSPWLIGVGPSLYFGTYGYGGFGWYGRPRYWASVYRGPAYRGYGYRYGPGVRVNVGVTNRYHASYGVGARGGYHGGGFHNAMPVHGGGFRGGGFHGGGHGGHR